MKISIRTRFTIGIIFLFIIILVLSVFSAFYLNKLSKKTSAILKENYLSVVYAREMSEGLTNINQELTRSFLIKSNADSLLIRKEMEQIATSLLSEKNNITEPGEDELVSGIESDYNEYRDSVLFFTKLSQSVPRLLFLQKKSAHLSRQLAILSRMNGKAIEVKTDDAKISSKNALAQMTILATLCFLIALGFTYSFASYFNERFFQLFNGIKEIVSSNYDQRLFFEGKDEFYEISLVFNEMAAKLNENKKKLSVTLQEDPGKNVISNDLQELKLMLARIKSMEEQAATLLSRIEKK